MNWKYRSSTTPEVFEEMFDFDNFDNYWTLTSLQKNQHIFCQAAAVKGLMAASTPVLTL